MNESNRIYVLTWDHYLADTYVIYAGLDGELAHDVHKFIGVHSVLKSKSDVDWQIENDAGVFRMHIFENGKLVAVGDSCLSTSLEKFEWRWIDPLTTNLELI